MRTHPRFGALVLLPILLLGWSLRHAAGAGSVAIRPHIEVSGATRAQLQMVRWAVGRFEVAGLEPPSGEIAFHEDPARCGNHLGFAKAGHVDVCTVLVNAMTRRALLHELSHVWLNENLRPSAREGFLQARGLPAWNSASDPWGMRGCEQAAEIMAWALGERILTPQIPDNDPVRIRRAYELLTERRVLNEPVYARGPDT